MKDYFFNIQEKIETCSSDVECRVRAVACIRLLLQQVTYGLLEWVSKQRPNNELQPEHSIIQSLRAPADGSLVDALETLLISCEQLGWAGVSRILLKRVSDRAAVRICSKGQNTLIGLLRCLVLMRNDGAEGHGLVGGYDREAELDALKFIVESLLPVLPVLADDGSTASLGNERVTFKLDFIRGWNGSPALIRKIKILSTERVRAVCQIDDGDVNRKDFNYDSVNPFHGLSGSKLPEPIIWNNAWEPLCYLPDKTTDSFTGRNTQIQELKEWMDDEGSRACLLYGDGGYGKTTLALEFLHRVLDEDIQVEWNPKVVLYYTAKRWQWGLNGLQPIAAGQPHLMELLSFLHMLLFGGYPTADFYKFDLSQAAIQLQGKIKRELDYARKDILVVIDNAETLIENEDERLTLGKELKEISRRIGRVLLTSRRHEHIEAAPVAVNVLSEDEAVKFLRDRAEKLNLNIVKKAKDSEIIEAIKKLERRPIVLEAFSNALTDSAIRKIEHASTRVFTMLRKDLGEFLFADAWARLSQDVRRLLLLMTQVGDVHDAQSLRICSDVVGVSAQSAEAALEESGGIASMVSIQGSIQITFSKNFLEYARDKHVRLKSGESSPSKDEIAKATGQYSAFIRKSQLFSGDRVVQAFRTPQAKAAHRERQEGNFVEARRLYDAAILTDSTNGWLRDRFAYFLCHDIRNHEAALHQAKKAVELLPDEGEVWLTRGLIEARLGQVRACTISTEKAESLGIKWSRCSIQRAWAYLKTKPAQLGLAEKELSRLKTQIRIDPHDVRLQQEVNIIELRLKYMMSIV
ncbi:hypothetical protein [Pantoea sp. SO10]|uniref:tetratricopeptide repeat protein n=1 Tax=Pantoea sp. SO10 TaxID=2575375 RepID=UPI0010C9D85A|nr:hypothetical protein [Pantoea sp. SO10]QCP62314.1 hypothetical protein FCN45_23160 [Pantoea sp. SO10]